MKQLIEILRERFDKNMIRHKGIDFKIVHQRLTSKPDSIVVLMSMEDTGGEPDVTGMDALTGGVIFTDCSAETPAGRRSLCYDRAGLESRKEHRPSGSAVEMAAAIGIELLTEEDYMSLQSLGPFDTKTSSWLKTPNPLRKAGGAIYGDHRYGRTFIGHNGPQSYYAVRGFRGQLTV